MGFPPIYEGYCGYVYMFLQYGFDYSSHVASLNDYDSMLIIK